jgi:PAS domain S-box-containing protein
VEQAVDAFFVVNAAGQIVDVNQNACDSLGYSRDELLQLTVADIQTTVSQADFELLWQQLRPGLPQTREGWHQRKDGTGFPVEVRLGLLDTGGDRYGLALARDISDRKVSEAAQARLAEIGELAAMIVHEVRSPLTTVLLGLNSFRTLDLPERSQARLTLALEESERLQKLLNEILLYSRDPTLDLEPVDINALVQTLALTLGQDLENPDSEAGPQIVVITLDHPVMVRGDRNKLKQVFINLIANAQEACPGDGTITWVVQSPEAGQVTVTVHNRGEAIAPEVLPLLTRPFFTTKSSGNGLGLAITKRIVEAHQGQLAIASSAESGTTVALHLPIIEPKNA